MILIISLCSDKLSEEEFVRPLVSIVGKCMVKQYTKVTKKDLETATHIILSGNPLQDNKYQHHNWSWIKQYKKPFLGICAGMHVIGIAHGSKMVKATRIGMTNVRVTRSGLLPQGKYEAYELHQYGITLPKGFIALAEKEGLLVMMQKGNIYGVLFHPEVRMEKIINNFLSLGSSA